jgi:AraC-like DNA-binding protein
MEILKVTIANILETRKKLRERFGKELTILPQELSSSSADDRFLNKAIKIIEEHLTESEFSVDDFIKEIGMSRSSLHIKLKALTDKSTTEFIRSIRLKTAAVFLKQTNQSISEIAYNTGFASPQYFSKCFKKVFGMLPTDYRQE